MKFKKVLIANRGEIALRIIRTLRELNIKAVCVYSEADRTSMHVKEADESYCIGPATSKDSYLNIEAIITALKISNADAVHPGYGFLAENPDFSDAVTKAGAIFIGPSGKAIKELGYKSTAREIAVKAGVAITPGSDGLVTKNHKQVAKKIGYPIMIKASAGGGGKGMRAAMNEKEFEHCLNMAKNESLAAFGDDGVYFEKLILKPRHIEIQVAADTHGNVIAFAERDCSMQRRHQKLVEESPSPFVTPAVRKKLANSAIKLVKASGYHGVGTVEFLMAQNKEFYFMEVNTRLQVEHPVTEMVSGLDLVRMQIHIAEGEKLEFTKERALEIHGHAIEHRINAEDMQHNFAPCPGTIDSWFMPGGLGVRVDSHVYTGYTIPSYYDSMIAKLIVWAPTREKALARSKRALSEFYIEGVKSTIDFHSKIINHKDFIKGDIDTSFLEKYFAEEKNKNEKIKNKK